MRVLKWAYFDSGTAITPFTRSASINSQTSPSHAESLRVSPTNRAACDQVDWVRYLIAVLNRKLPSTNNTSPGLRMALRVSALWTENGS